MAAYRRVLCIWFVICTIYGVLGDAEPKKSSVVHPKFPGSRANRNNAGLKMEGGENPQFRVAGNPRPNRKQNLPIPGVGDGLNVNAPRQGMAIQQGNADAVQNEQAFINRKVNVPSKNRSPPRLGSKDIGQPPRRPAPIKIAESSPCAREVKQYCSTSSVTNNFAVLDCLQNDRKAWMGIGGPDDELTEGCQHFIWNYKKNLTTDIRFDSAAMEVCRDALKSLPDCDAMPRGTGQVISCLIEEKENISSANCKQFLTKMASIVFSDFRLIYKFADACSRDISQHNCGRLHSEGDESPSSQGKTIECLSEQIGSLDDKCKHEILRIAELQADDYHMDRPLFYACREDRERFCRRTKAGAGKIFKCLYRHKFERDITQKCREQLVLRQKLIQENYKASHGMVEACRKDIRRQNCLKGKDIPNGKHAKLSHILLCLEGARKEGQDVTPECLAEMIDWRKTLLEDFKISPDIVTNCADEIRDSCDGGLQREGKTLHCLMDLARPRARDAEKKTLTRAISTKCLRSLEDLLRETDPGEDYRLDPALQEACQPVVDTTCKDIEAGDARVLSCLMENLDEEKVMTDECKEKLLEIQYFISRDFSLDARLYKACRKDAVSQCHAKKNWYDPKSTMPEQGPLIFTCLYTHLKRYPKDPALQLSRGCSFEVQRVMRQRAVSVDLEPRIEDACLKDLGLFCSDKLEKGEEMQCLQENFKELAPICKSAVGNFTEDAAGDVGLDRILMKACTPMIKNFCGDLLEKGHAEPGDVMECLIKHKHSGNMNRKCFSGIEHHQLLSLKDFRFSYKFKEACKKNVMTLCTGIKKKADVVQCLSEHVRNDTLLEEEHRVHKACRKQLSFELLQRSENIKLDPKLLEACHTDKDRFCSNVTPGSSAVISCLRKNQKHLSQKCHIMIFNREKEEARDNSIDYKIMTVCKRMIMHHCSDFGAAQVLECLKKVKDDAEFDGKCRKVITAKEILHSKDYRLNPALTTNCKMDIPKFCRNVISQHHKSDAFELDGLVINCLKEQYRKHRLSSDCEAHIMPMVKEATLDYRQDPMLAENCNMEIQTLCKDAIPISDDESGPKGMVEECLKKKLSEQKIKNKKCQKEILRVIMETKVDIHVDPLLMKACAVNLKHFCYDVPAGEGRQMSCLLNALEDKKSKLDPTCRKMLQNRVDMWAYAAKLAPPESVNELMEQISSSPAKNYFMGVLFAAIGMIFLGGLFCGRVTKRVLREAKNK